MFKYACLNPIAPIGLNQLGNDYERTEDFFSAGAVFVRSAKMEGLTPGPDLLAVARAGAGVNNIPHAEYAKNGVVVFNTPGANANGVKEIVIAGMLLAARDIVGGVGWVRANALNETISKDVEKAKKTFAGTEINGKKLGVIGLGAIGQQVANAATGLGMTVYGYDPYISVDAAWNLSRAVRHCKNVETIYSECDYITIHVPLTDTTKYMIGKEALSMMKGGVVILNFARDLLVDENAVLGAIASGRVRRYVSDFPNTTIVGKPGVIITPHLGASTEESEDNCAIMAAREIRDYLENGNIVNSVNYPACSLGPCKVAGRVAILHKNVAAMIASFTTILSQAGVNIAEMANKSRGDYAYTLFDLDTAIPPPALEALTKLSGVIKVRVIK